jgi:hypothetical protein
MTRKVPALLLVACALVLALPGAAAADTVVRAGQTVVEITAIGENVTLNGTSAGSVIVIDGNLTIGPHGHAGHGVTLLGGRLVTAPGATIDGDVFQLAGPLPHPSGQALLAVGVALLLARGLLVWLLVRIARLLAAWPTAGTMLAASRGRPIRSAIVGTLLAAGLSAGTLLLALSVVGLLAAAALAAVLLLSACLGVAFAWSGIGHDRERQNTTIVALLVPILGDLLLALATIVALGAAFHYLVDERAARARPATTNP